MKTKKILLFFFSFFYCYHLLFSQSTIKGTIKSAEGYPLEAASVFFSNTSLGTTSDKNGHFELVQPSKQGTYTLVITYVGYEIYQKQLELPKLLFDRISITLQPRPNTLSNVIVKPYEKGDWNTWGKLFSDLFLGIMPESANCKILNYNTLDFKYYSQNDLLEVTAKKPLKILNRALGYELDYILEEFKFDGATDKVHFAGYSKFTELETNNTRTRENWEKARKRVYFGSQMHFMRSMFANRLQEEGFRVRREKLVGDKLKNQKPEEKATSLLDLIQPISDYENTHNKITIQDPENIQSSEKINFTIKTIDLLPESIQVTADSLIFPQNEWQKLMQFPHLIRVTHKNDLMEKSYEKFLGLSAKNDQLQSTWLEIREGKAIVVEASGLYYSPTDIFSFGYWSWREKIATMLPIDYFPSSH